MNNWIIKHRKLTAFLGLVFFTIIGVLMVFVFRRWIAEAIIFVFYMEFILLRYIKYITYRKKIKLNSTPKS